MSSLKTLIHRFFLCTAILAFAAPLPALSQGQASTSLLRQFATCTGRLSALMEFQFMTDGPASEITRARRDAAAALMAAVTAPDEARQALAWRIEAKAAQAALLQRATFGTDRRFAVRARRLALRQTAECEAMLLG